MKLLSRLRHQAPEPAGETRAEDEMPPEAEPDPDAKYRRGRDPVTGKFTSLKRADGTRM